MRRLDGASVAGGNLTRGLLVASLSLATPALTACMEADGTGRIDDGRHYANDTDVTRPEWGIVDKVQVLPNGTMAVRIASCLLAPGGERHVGTKDELVTVSQNPNGGVRVISEGLVVTSDGKTFTCAVDVLATQASGYSEGQVVPVPTPAGLDS